MMFLSYLIVWVGGVCVGAISGRKWLARRYPTLQEKIDAVMKAGTPKQADDLIRLASERMIAGAGHHFNLHLKVGLVDIRTPDREHFALLMQDVEGFERAVIAANEAQPDLDKKMPDDAK